MMRRSLPSVSVAAGAARRLDGLGHELTVQCGKNV